MCSRAAVNDGTSVPVRTAAARWNDQRRPVCRQQHPSRCLQASSIAGASNFRNAQPSDFTHNIVIEHLEPEVPYQHGPRERFYAESPYDFICLTRSPLYAPATADLLYDEIAANFIEPI